MSFLFSMETAFQLLKCKKLKLHQKPIKPFLLQEITVPAAMPPHPEFIKIKLSWFDCHDSAWRNIVSLSSEALKRELYGDSGYPQSKPFSCELINDILFYFMPFIPFSFLSLKFLCKFMISYLRTRSTVASK